MNESELRVMLAERVDDVEIGPVPIEVARRDGDRMRRRSVLVASLGIAAVVAAVAATAVLVRPGTDGSLPTTQRTGQNITKLPGNVPSENDLVGTWLAVALLGKPASQWGMTAEQLSLDIRTEDGRFIWGSQEVCNGAGWRADLGPGGELSTYHFNMTAMYCGPPDGKPTVPQVVMKAQVARIDGDKLTLYGTDGSPLATFVRAGSDSLPTNGSLCEQAFSQEVGSETATTVGAIRHWGIGPGGNYPAQDAFGEAPDSAPAAWCWVYTGSAWAAYGVGPDGSSVLFGEVPSNGEGHAPSGGPAFP